MTEPAIELTESQRAALARVGCAVEPSGGIVLLCGPSGAGTTTVLHALAESAALRQRETGLRRFADWAAEPGSAVLPGIILADDAHEAAADEILAFWDRCRHQRPQPSLVLAGQGRLLSVVARDPRIEREVRLRAILRSFTSAESGGLVAAILSRRATRAPGPNIDFAPVLTAIHEIAGGIPATIVRITELAALIAESRPDRGISAADIEAIHQRLSLRAA